MPAKKTTKAKKKMPNKASVKKVSTKKVSIKKASKVSKTVAKKKYRLNLKLHWQIINLKLRRTNLEKMKNI